MRAEIDLNDFKVDDDDLKDSPDIYLGRVTLRGFRFAGACLEQARPLEESPDLRAAVVTWLDEDFMMTGSTVRFFVRRGELPDRFVELERFKFEAIAVIGLEDIPKTGYEVLDEALSF